MTYVLWVWMLRGSASLEIAAEPPEERFQNVATKLVADKFTGPPRADQAGSSETLLFKSDWPCKFKYGK